MVSKTCWVSSGIASEGPVLLASMAGKRGEARHEEMEMWEQHRVDSQLSKVSVKVA